MAKYTYILLLLLLASSCSVKKTMVQKETIVETLKSETKDTTIEVPGRSMDTTLLISDVIPTDTTEKRTTKVSKNGINTTLTSQGKTLKVDVDVEGLKYELKGYIREEVKRETTIDTVKKEKKHPSISIVMAVGLAAFVGFIFWAINKFL